VNDLSYDFKGREKRPNQPFDSKTDAIMEKTPSRVVKTEFWAKNQALNDLKDYFRGKLKSGDFSQ
jgi:hypothetical protein